MTSDPASGRPPDGSQPTRDPLVRLVSQLQRHEPADAREHGSLRRTLAMITWLRAPLDQTADPCHITSSGIVVDGDGLVLLHRHKRLGIWLQPGGHVDLGETCEQAVLREVAEETGLIATLDTTASPLHVDVHDGPRGHLHLDIRWLLRVPAGSVPAPAPDESPDVRFFTPTDALATTDTAARAAIHAALRLT